MSCNLNEKIVYSVQKSFDLGDHFRNILKDETVIHENKSQMFLAAKLCYTLPSIREHPLNDFYHSTQSRTTKYNQNSKKLADLEEWKSTAKFTITREPKAIPRECLHLIKSFYVPWLNHLKPDLRVCSVHVVLSSYLYVLVP